MACCWRRRLLKTYQARTAASTATATAPIAIPALAPAERDVRCAGKEVGLDVEDGDEGEVDVDDESGTIIAAAPHFPKSLLQPVPQ